MKQLIILVTGLFWCASAWAAIRLPKFFGDGMVLQRDQPIPLWGWAAPNEKLTVQFRSQTKTVRAGRDGKWKTTLAAEAAGGPFVLTFTGKNKIVLNDVLVGDLWICSGQSNMEWPVAQSNNAAQEIAAANNLQIRHFKVATTISGAPLDDLMHSGSWKAATPETVGSFTAVGYFFARELHNQLGVPIGLLNTTWGGTDVETWTSREAFEKSPEFKNMIRSVGVINLDSAAKARSNAAVAKLKNIQGGLPDAAATASFSNMDFDDAAWPRMVLPNLWEGGPLPDVDGVVWFRKTIELTATLAGEPAELHLALIDDGDETFVNGTKVGHTMGYNQKRMYKIPPGVLKAGKNVIAVRVEDTGGGGGIYGDAGDVKLVINKGVQSLAGDWLFQVETLSAGSTAINPNSYPTLLYNAMIHPLIPVAMKGVIWYQGESNAGRAYQYRKAFPLMIQDWRSRWGHDFPFYFVQLASFNANGGDTQKGSGWAELREAQTMTLQLPNTGMAVTTDIGEAADIHPRNKQDVGLRLAAIALHKAYGKQIVSSGPVYQSMEVDGNKVLVQFTSKGGGLVARDKYGYLRGFEVAGADQRFHYAKAFVQGDAVVVYADEVTAPVAVRYGWADDAGEANLYNKEGFPAGPFRTDRWKGVTESATYRNAR